MPAFSKISQSRLETCHHDLQVIFTYVVKHFDCSVIWGFRGKKAQNLAYEGGFSTKKWPDSTHNFEPSEGIDVIPYPINWNNTRRMLYFIGFVLGVAQMLKDYGMIEHDIISGRDWDDDTVLTDQRFNDFAHFQIKR